MILLIFIVAGFHEQTDWMGGSGMHGPVTNWGTQYYTGDSITTASGGQASLIATQTNYDNWTKHIIDTNSGIPTETQGLMPVDVDRDGDIDFVAHTNDSVVWYKNEGNWNYLKQVIGPASDNGKNSPCVWPEDINKDSLIDVLVATDGGGAGWYKNLGGGSWGYNVLDASKGYHRICSADVDLNGTIDILAVDNSVSQYCGKIWLFRNTGGSFNKELIKDFGTQPEGWRVYPADFNKDGYPDLYSVFYHTYIFLNDKAGHFDSVYFHSWGGPGFDGAWAQDIDMDNDLDLVTANAWAGGFLTPYGFWVHKNDGACNFTLEPLAIPISGNNDYSDGAIAKDIDLDGFPDLAGTYKKVGWFRQDTSSAASAPFEEHFIDAVTNSHWIYAEDVDRGCVPDIDLIVTDEGSHIVYENRMLSRFALKGELVSSVLELNAQAKEINWFGWTACLPKDSTLAFYYRGDTVASDIDTVTWKGPFYATNEIDSMAIPPWPCYRYFQYKVNFYPDTFTIDIAVLKSVWVKDTICGAGIEETTPHYSTTPLLNYSITPPHNDKILLNSPNTLNKAELSIYNIVGEIVQSVYKGTILKGNYEFISCIKAKGVYLVVLKWQGGTKTTKFVKML